MSDFEREERYIVLKIYDANDALTEEDWEHLEDIERKVNTSRDLKGKLPLECAVVESDWPMYEEVWDKIERGFEDEL